MKTVPCAWLVLFPVTAYAADTEELRAALRAANANDDGARLVATADALLAEFSGHPTYLFLRARGAALQGDNEAALRTLDEMTRRGADLVDNARLDDAFDDALALPAFEDIEMRANRLRESLGNATREWSFGHPATIPEAVAVDDTGHVYLGSVRQRQVLVRDPDGGVRTWRDPALWSIQGMHLSPDGSQLWVATSGMNVTVGISAAERGRSALVAFDVGRGAIVSRHELREPGEHVLGDFIFLDEHTLLATDSSGGGVYALDTRSGAFTQRIPPGVLRSPQGLARRGQHVFIADYSKGLYRFDPASNRLHKVDDGPAAPYGIDGLYVWKDSLIAIHNGIRPHQVTRYWLSDDGARIVAHEILLANHPDFDEPTLGTVNDNRLLLVANSQWNRFADDGALRHDNLKVPVILSLPLERTSAP